MKKFLAVFTGTPNSPQRLNWDKLDEASRKTRQATGMKAWGDWMVKHKSSLVEQGGPLGKTTRVSPQGIAEVSNNLAGYVVVQAESKEAAARLFENHPHFTIFPGESAEIMEILPIPNQ